MTLVDPVWPTLRSLLPCCLVCRRPCLEKFKPPCLGWWLILELPWSLCRTLIEREGDSMGNLLKSFPINIQRVEEETVESQEEASKTVESYMVIHFQDRLGSRLCYLLL